jgi:hypothetical protein
MAENILEIASDLAEKDMRKQYGDKHYDNVLCIEDNNVIIYTEEGQDIFNDLYAKYYSIIERNKHS